jgi:predicted kinase
MLIAMAGLPATGKSTVAARLAAALGGVVLDKDRVRAALFPPPALDYSDRQNDLSIAAILSAAAYLLEVTPQRAVILDGRTFLRSYQVRDLCALAAAVNQPAHVIECVNADEVVRERLEKDVAGGTHPAGNRTYALYQAVKAAAEPLQVPRLVLDTGTTSLDECVRRCLDYLRPAGA